mgnify:CR=1 FL=1
MGVGFGGICMKIPTAIQASSKLYYFVLHAPRRLYYHMKTWAPSPLALPLNERGGQRDVYRCVGDGRGPAVRLCGRAALYFESGAVAAHGRVGGRPLQGRVGTEVRPDTG